MRDATRLAGYGSCVLAASAMPLEASGIGVVDIALTAVVAAAATGALYRMSERSCSPPAAAAVAVTVAVVAALTGQRLVLVAAIAAALVAVGVATTPVRRSTASLRTAGALAAAFTSTVGAIALDADITPPGSVAVPLLILAMPLLDGLTVGLTRIRRGRLRRHTVGLAARLRARDLGFVAVDGVLVATAIGTGALAVACVQAWLAPAVAVAAGTLVIGALAVATGSAPVPAPPGRLSQPTRILLGLLVLGAAAAVVPTMVAVARAREPAAAAVEAAQRAVAAAQEGDSDAAAAAFAEARAGFDRAQDVLHGPLASVGLSVPVLAPNLRAARDLSVVGIELSEAGVRLATTADPQRLRIVAGTVPLDELERLEPELIRTREHLVAASERIGDIDRTFLAAPLIGWITTLDAQVRDAVEETRVAAASARLLPSILGGDEPRRYFLAIQNNAESRATGGFIGNWGEIVADDGHVELTRFERIFTLNAAIEPGFAFDAPDDYLERYGQFQPGLAWPNINYTPDFPTLGTVIANLYPQYGGAPLDGVIAVDPVGLRSILRVTGPIIVPGWPEPVSAATVVEVTLHEAYVAIPDRDQREQFLGDLAELTWDAFTTQDLGSPERVISALSEAVRTKHLMVWFERPEEQRLAERVGLSGSVPRTDDDLLLVTTSSVGANKIDWFLRRGLRYTVDVEPRPGGEELDVHARLEIELENLAPASGLPQVVIGPGYFGQEPGVNYTFLSIYSDLELVTATVDGLETSFDDLPEFGRVAYSHEIAVPSGAKTTVVVELAGQLETTDGWYALDVGRQPLIAPDDVELLIAAPAGFRFAQAAGVRVEPGDRRAVASLALDRDARARVRVVRDERSRG